MRVEPTRVTFAIKITNLGQGPVSLKIRLQYTQGGGGPVFRDCPGAPSAYLLTVPAASTVITDQGQCAVPRADRSLAYSAAGWVLAADATDGSYRLSPAANVYADHTIWKPDLL
ncbi:hypothetical protein [Streptomyces katrae]|nr:hypothetical protein [Streptomyces katrae]